MLVASRESIAQVSAGTMAVWGIGSLCEHFQRTYPQLSPLFFVDSNAATETYKGVSLVLPTDADFERVDYLVLCSSYVSQIVPVCLEMGLSPEQIYVVLPRTYELLPLTHFDKIGDGYHYYLWRSEQHKVDALLSSEMVYPGVYEDIAKSVSYCIYSSVQGHFAEFGTCTGSTASLLGYCLGYYRKHMEEHEKRHGMVERELHLFDSFQGFPKATNEVDLQAPHVASGAWAEGTAKELSEQRLSEVCAEFLPVGQIKTYPGWFDKTLRDIPQTCQYALVHIDCDLYQSTIEVLDYLFTRKHLSRGAIILFDNWFCNTADPQLAEQKAWNETVAKFNVQSTNLGIYGCVGNRFIVHQYC